MKMVKKKNLINQMMFLKVDETELEEYINHKSMAKIIKSLETPKIKKFFLG